MDSALCELSVPSSAAKSRSAKPTGFAGVVAESPPAAALALPAAAARSACTASVPASAATRSRSSNKTGVSNNFSSAADSPRALRADGGSSFDAGVSGPSGASDDPPLASAPALAPPASPFGEDGFFPAARPVEMRLNARQHKLSACQHTLSASRHTLSASRHKLTRFNRAVSGGH